MRVVVISGYFNPIHTGHLDYIKAASKLGDKLIVIVNNDDQVKIKGSVEFMDEFDRMRIASAIKGVGKVVLSIDKTESVIETLKSIYNEYAVDYFFDSMVFANGGDRRREEIPEAKVCKELNIEMIDGLGDKIRSSSDYTGLK